MAGPKYLALQKQRNKVLATETQRGVINKVWKSKVAKLSIDKSYDPTLLFFQTSQCKPKLRDHSKYKNCDVDSKNPILKEKQLCYGKDCLCAMDIWKIETLFQIFSRIFKERIIHIYMNYVYISNASACQHRRLIA